MTSSRSVTTSSCRISSGTDLGDSVYRKAPWAIYRKGDSWIYLGISPLTTTHIHRVAVFSGDHTHCVSTTTTGTSERGCGGAWRR